MEGNSLKHSLHWVTGQGQPCPQHQPTSAIKKLHIAQLNERSLASHEIPSFLIVRTCQHHHVNKAAGHFTAQLQHCMIRQLLERHIMDRQAQSRLLHFFHWPQWWADSMQGSIAAWQCLRDRGLILVRLHRQSTLHRKTREVGHQGEVDYGSDQDS